MKDFPVVVVANYFVEKGKKEGQPVEGILKLIKLVYIGTVGILISMKIG